jgi:CHAD domain-containing protein
MSDLRARSVPSARSLVTPKAIHELHRRVRSARTVYRRTGSPPVPGLPVGYLRKLGRELGSGRDREVHSELLREFARRGYVPDRDRKLLLEGLEREHERLKRRLLRRLEGRELRRHLIRLPPAGRPVVAPTDRKGPSNVRARLSEARRRAIRTSAASDLHRFRKRLREALLVLGPGLGAPGGRRGSVAGETRGLLKQLGKVHDLAQLVDWLRDQESVRRRPRIFREIARAERGARREVLSRLRDPTVRAWCEPPEASWAAAEVTAARPRSRRRRVPGAPPPAKP